MDLEDTAVTRKDHEASDREPVARPVCPLDGVTRVTMSSIGEAGVRLPSKSDRESGRGPFTFRVCGLMSCQRLSVGSPSAASA